MGAGCWEWKHIGKAVLENGRWILREQGECWYLLWAFKSHFYPEVTSCLFGVLTCPHQDMKGRGKQGDESMKSQTSLDWYWKTSCCFARFLSVVDFNCREVTSGSRGWGSGGGGWGNNDRQEGRAFLCETGKRKYTLGKVVMIDSWG